MCVSANFSVSDLVIRPISFLLSPQEATYEEVVTSRAVQHDTNIIVSYDSADLKA